MNSNNADPSYETSEIGTPLDYTEDLYRFYFEIRDANGVAERALKSFLGSEHAKRLHRLTHGFEMDLPIQSVPDLIRILSGESIAIYQVVRYAKVDGAWQ
jgi:hypothetical protein